MPEDHRIPEAQRRAGGLHLQRLLFLFRKHEQGNNAVEIPQFDPLIAELEKKIAELKRPVKQKYELVKVK